jgi:hypothetical protein
MNRTSLGIALLAVAALGVSSPASGQILPDSPRLTGVLEEARFGVFYLRPSALPRDDMGVLVTWKPSGLPASTRLRFGGGTGAGDTEAGFAALDVRVPLRPTAEGSVRLAWTAGIGASYGEWGVVSLPLGLVAGVVWSEGAVTLSPWAGVGVGFDFQFGDEAPDEDFEVRPAADLGLDLSFDEARRFTVRAGLSLGDRNAVAVGIAIR